MSKFMRLVPWVVGAAFSAGLIAQAQAQQVNLQVRYMAANCANCHGTSGNAQPGMPVLAGLNKDYFITAMNEFRAGTRQATIMHQIAKGYSDEQIALMADYFAAQPRN